ncbi:hypothetical protein GALL_546480 [mine drainage metagenome]|uniref:Uncharacterized protein n=1 Tax=mine drainage metagenome TaxID=410659 RepID=A0A1J5PEY6_9ZZZZ
MKLPMRPNASPGGISGATKSMICNQAYLRVRANQNAAAITPSSPPWKDMPPSHTAMICAGWEK